MICTGNICRSPLAERLLARELQLRGVTATVSSAGLVTEDMPASPEVVELLAAAQLDGRDHRSRRMHPGMVGESDLVVGMAREHVREAVLLDPEAVGRAFTLKELVRRGRAIGPRLGGEPLAGWLERAAAGRSLRASLGSSPDDDIVDPIGRGLAVHRRVGAEIGELTGALAELVWPTLR